LAQGLPHAVISSGGAWPIHEMKSDQSI